MLHKIKGFTETNEARIVEAAIEQRQSGATLFAAELDGVIKQPAAQAPRDLNNNQFKKNTLLN